jgi:hypothetical protein
VQLLPAVLFFVAAPAVSILWHETAHAFMALALTAGTVSLTVGFGPSVSTRLGRLWIGIAPLPLGGICTYDGTMRRGDRALIAAAGPVSSAFLAALAWNLQARAPHTLGSSFMPMLAVTSLLGALFTAVPIRYGPRVESDGLSVLRAFFPFIGESRGVPRAERRPQRPLRLPFMLVLLAVTPIAFMASFWVSLQLVGLFGVAYWLERR